MTFIWIILILLVAFNVYNFVSIKLLHKELPKIFGYSVLEVVSGSMEPTIMVGDLIVIDTNCEEYQKGDIITFRDVNGSFVTHRIIEIGVDEMITKGDNNDSLDEAMSPATIVGKYVTRIPQLGSVMSSLKNPLVMALILAIGIIVCFLVSTDKDLKPKLTDEEKEFLEFKKLKEEEKKKENQLAEVEKETVSSDEIVKIDVKRTKKTIKIEKNGQSVSTNNNKKNYNNSRRGPSNNSRYSSNNTNNRKYNSQNKKTNTGANHKKQGNIKNAGKNNYTQHNKKTYNNNRRAQVNNKNQNIKRQSNQNNNKNK